MIKIDSYIELIKVYSYISLHVFGELFWKSCYRIQISTKAVENPENKKHYSNNVFKYKM